MWTIIVSLVMAVAVLWATLKSGTKWVRKAKSNASIVVGYTSAKLAQARISLGFQRIAISEVAGRP
ncbi:hypothetical protein AEM38_15240 [Hyphomonadaceae bacterium UKL13-1]|nr:hypothetical protein AEM38_15240 [Hyphomonadaceae bacterium UKL13-1]